jgi:hypothetical protein
LPVSLNPNPTFIIGLDAAFSIFFGIIVILKILVKESYNAILIIRFGTEINKNLREKKYAYILEADFSMTCDLLITIVSLTKNDILNNN